MLEKVGTELKSSVLNRLARRTHLDYLLFRFSLMRRVRAAKKKVRVGWSLLRYHKYYCDISSSIQSFYFSNHNHNLTNENVEISVLAEVSTSGGMCSSLLKIKKEIIEFPV